MGQVDDLEQALQLAKAATLQENIAVEELTDQLRCHKKDSAAQIALLRQQLLYKDQEI